jgi:hypothetical protein
MPATSTEVAAVVSGANTGYALAVAFVPPRMYRIPSAFVGGLP